MKVHSHTEDSSEDSSSSSSSSEVEEPKGKKKKLAKTGSDDAVSKGATGFIKSDKDKLQPGDKDLPLSQARFDQLLLLME